MFEFTPDTAPEMVTATVAICNLIAYFAFYHLANVMNRGRKGKNISPRTLGCIAMVVVSVLLFRYSQTHLVDVEKYLTLSPREQGEYMGRVLRSIVFPPLIFLAVIAVRAWRDKQERLARERRNATQA